MESEDIVRDQLTIRSDREPYMRAFADGGPTSRHAVCSSPSATNTLSIQQPRPPMLIRTLAGWEPASGLRG